MTVNVLLFRTVVFALICIPFQIYGQVGMPEFRQKDPGNFDQPLAYSYVRPADVFWARRVWRVVDLRQKFNQPYYYPLHPSNGRVNLITAIKNGIRLGQIQPYDPAYGDDFKKKMNSEYALSIGYSRDTVMIPEANPPYRMVPKVVVREFDPATVTRFKIKEDWYFDKARSVLKFRIIGICPVREVYSETGEFKGFQDMYWIPYKQARPILCRFELYNPANGFQRLNYDQALQVHLFHSFIYKVDNTKNRAIWSYLKGTDALLKSSEITKEIRRLENDLWSY